MKKNQVDIIAENTNVSPATVSKVINHRPGPSSKVRQMVFAEYDRMGFKKRESPVAVYVILPEIPQYFWSRDFTDRIGEGLRIKYNIYSRMGDDDIVLRYLHQAIELEAKVIVIAAKINDEMRALLDRFSVTGLVIYLTEYNQSQGSIYVGGDAVNEGWELALLYRRYYREGDSLLMITQPDDQWSGTSKTRCTTFLKYVSDCVPFGCCPIDISAYTNLLPALIAREMKPYLVGGAYNRIICFHGFTHSLCHALYKLRLPYPIVCFGFEDTLQNKKYADMGMLGGIVSQDFRAQMNTALALTADFLTKGIRPAESQFIIPCNTIEY